MLLVLRKRIHDERHIEKIDFYIGHQLKIDSVLQLFNIFNVVFASQEAITSNQL